MHACAHGVTQKRVQLSGRQILDSQRGNVPRLIRVRAFGPSTLLRAAQIPARAISGIQQRQQLPVLLAFWHRRTTVSWV